LSLFFILVTTAQNPRATWTPIPIAEVNWETCKMVFHLLVPPIAFSGITTMSPGRSSALVAPPPHIPPEPPTTDPLARITKTDFLFAICVGPPACFKYHSALWPGL
jgi:hypothetical protein